MVILENQNGKFTDVTDKVCPEIKNIGMITDALWSDFDNDGKVDLVVVGEWMPVTFFRNTGKGFVRVTNTGIENNVGWWNSLVAGDFDNDGDIDYAAGNLGLNTNYKGSKEEPLTIVAKDIDNNGSLDAMVFCYMKAEDGTMKPFPMATKEDMASQVISTRKKFPDYKSYGVATMNDIWSEKDRQDAIVLQANDMTSSYIENAGNGKFKIKSLPLEAQAAPAFGMMSEDVDGDGDLDLLMVGNDYGMDPYSGHHDAFTGLCLRGDGEGNFTAMPVAESGFFVNGDAKALTKIHSASGEDIYLATQNQDSIMVYTKTNYNSTDKNKWIDLKPEDFCADITYKDNHKKHVEFYYGNSYLSQSSRKLQIDNDAVKIIITNFKESKREVINR